MPVKAAGAADAMAGFVRGDAGLTGGLVNASRSVTFPKSADGARTLNDWRAAITEAIDTAQADLRDV